jgi:hypothetical protein
MDYEEVGGESMETGRNLLQRINNGNSFQLTLGIYNGI